MNNRTVRIRRANPANLSSREIEVGIDGGEWIKEYELDRDPGPADFVYAVEVGCHVWGPGRRGERAGCTNSMVHEIWDAMRDIAGC